MMVTLGKLLDATTIDDPVIESFLKKYSHFIFPRKTPIEIHRVGSTIVINNRIHWGENGIFLRGKIFDENVYVQLPENIAKYLLIDYGDFEELVLAAAALGGKPVYTMKTKIFISFGRILLVFSRTIDDYYFIDFNSIVLVNTIDTIKQILKKAQDNFIEDYDKLIFGQKALTYVKEYNDFLVTLHYTPESFSVTISRRDEYPSYPAGEVIYTMSLPIDSFEMVATIIPTLDNPVDIVKYLMAMLL